MFNTMKDQLSMKATNCEGTNSVINTIATNQVQFVGVRVPVSDRVHYQARVAYIINSYWLSMKIDFKVMKVMVGKDNTFGAHKLVVISNDYRHEVDMFISGSTKELLAKINGAYEALTDLGL